MAKERKKDAQLVKKRKGLDGHKKRKAEVRGFKGFEACPDFPPAFPTLLLWA